jgi:Flp pilus assembly protein TadG
VSARRRDDRGAAAVELGVLLGLMVLVAAVMYPIGQAFYEKMRIGRASGDAIRFATAAPNSPAYGSTGRRPTVDEIKAEAIRAYTAAGGSGVTPADVQVTGTRRPGDTVTVRITKTVDLGPLGSVLSAVHVTNSRVITVTVDASGREE